MIELKEASISASASDSAADVGQEPDCKEQMQLRTRA